MNRLVSDSMLQRASMPRLHILTAAQHVERWQARALRYDALGLETLASLCREYAREHAAEAWQLIAAGRAS